MRSVNIMDAHADEMHSKPLLAAYALGKHYGHRIVLDAVNIALHAGEIVSLVGPNGAGKTTLVRCLLGLVKPSAGRVERSADCRIGYVPQHMQINPVMPLTAGQFLALGTTAPPDLGLLKRLQVQRMLDVPMHGLSGGQMRRVLLARALMHAPTLLVLDEPVAGGDMHAQATLYHDIRDIARSNNIAVLMVSHDVHLVMAGSDKVICLNRHVCCQGKPEQVNLDPAFVQLFGADLAAQLAGYVHHHDHHHTASGECISGQHSEACQHD